MVALIPIISQIISALLKGGQMKQEEADKIRADLAEAEIQRDKTFAEFIQSTSNILYTLMRNAIVGVFAAALVIPHWGQTLSQNAQAMPVYFWAIIAWEFWGNQALQIFPWVRPGNGNGSTAPQLVPAPKPSSSLEPDRGR